MYCKDCGNKLNPSDKYCTRCGSKLDNYENNTENNNDINNSSFKETNISLIFGITACIFLFIPLFSIPLAITAIILGIINRKKQKLTGLILGIISIILTIIEFILIIIFINSVIIKGAFPHIEETFNNIIEEHFEISGNTFMATDSSIINFFSDGSYFWSMNDDVNYNKGTYIVYEQLEAYNYAKNFLEGFNFDEYDIDDFYLIIMTPKEIMVNGNIIEDTNTVYYYGEYDSDDKTLELFNHNTKRQLELTLYNTYKQPNIDI